MKKIFRVKKGLVCSLLTYQQKLIITRLKISRFRSSHTHQTCRTIPTTMITRIWISVVNSAVLMDRPHWPTLEMFLTIWPHLRMPVMLIRQWYRLKTQGYLGLSIRLSLNWKRTPLSKTYSSEKSVQWTMLALLRCSLLPLRIRSSCQDATMN